MLFFCYSFVLVVFVIVDICFDYCWFSFLSNFVWVLWISVAHIILGLADSSLSWLLSELVRLFFLVADHVYVRFKLIHHWLFLIFKRICDLSNCSFISQLSRLSIQVLVARVNINPKFVTDDHLVWILNSRAGRIVTNLNKALVSSAPRVQLLIAVQTRTVNNFITVEVCELSD